MTHDELLERLHIEQGCPVGDALHAVVELHKPKQRCWDATCYCKDMCSKCRVDYPCETIQAIEKELL